MSYDILENICEITDADTILDCSNDNGEFETAAINYGFKVEKNIQNRKYGVIFASNSLNNLYDVNDKLAKYVDCFFGCVFSRITFINNEIKQLAKQRDTLLPLLMNGQVEVK